MPPAVPFIVQIGGTALGYTAMQVAVATFISSVVVGKYTADRAEEKARRAYNRSLQDRLVTVRSATATRKYVLGTVRTGGALMLGESILTARVDWAPAKSYLDLILAWAANECELVGYYIDDEYVAAASFPPAKFDVAPTSQRWMGGVTGSPTSATISLPYAPDAGSVVAFCADPNIGAATALTVSGISGVNVTLSGLPASTSVTVDLSYTTSTADKLRQQFKSGLGTQTSSDWGGDPASPRWTSNHRLRGVAHSRFCCLWDEAAYQSGAPEFTAVLKGRGADGHPFYDPRTDTYPTYTDNPALLAAWWMTLPRARGGCGYPSDWIDWFAVVDAANVCDELVTVKTLDGSSTESIKRYQCHTVLDTAEPPLANLDKILRSMAGQRGFTGGKYKIVAGAFRAATVTITDDDIVGTKPITLDPTGGDVTPANIATGTFADATKKWQGTGPTTITNSTYVTLDGAESTINVELPSTTDPRQANYLMGLAIELSRPCLRGGLSVKGIGENIALFDTVQLSITNRSVYAGKTFEVVSSTDNWDGTFDLTLNEIKSASYALDYTTWTPLVQPTPPDLSYLWSVDAVAGLDVQIGTPQLLPSGKSVASIAMSWTAHTQDSVIASGRIELRYRRIGDAGYTSLGDVEGYATDLTFSAPLKDGSTYEFSARARNGVGAVSKWKSFYVTVSGDQALVANLLQNAALRYSAWPYQTWQESGWTATASHVAPGSNGATGDNGAVGVSITGPVDTVNNAGGLYVPSTAPGVACSPGDRLEASAYVAVYRGTAYLYVTFFDSSNAKIADVLVEDGVASCTEDGRAFDATLASKTRLWGFVTAPANAARAYITLSLRRTSSSGNTDGYLNEPYIGIPHQEQTQPSPWLEGSGAVDTDLIAPDAATVVATQTFSDTSNMVTAVGNVLWFGGGGYWTDIVTVSYTATDDCVAVITATGRGYAHAATGDLMTYPSAQILAVVDSTGYRVGTPATLEAVLDGDTREEAFSLEHRFLLFAGQAATITLQGRAGAGDTTNSIFKIRDGILKIEIIKR